MSNNKHSEAIDKLIEEIKKHRSSTENVVNKDMPTTPQQISKVEPLPLWKDRDKGKDNQS